MNIAHVGWDLGHVNAEQLGSSDEQLLQGSAVRGLTGAFDSWLSAHHDGGSEIVAGAEDDDIDIAGESCRVRSRERSARVAATDQGIAKWSDRLLWLAAQDLRVRYEWLSAGALCLLSLLLHLPMICPRRSERSVDMIDDATGCLLWSVVVVRGFGCCSRSKTQSLQDYSRARIWIVFVAVGIHRGKRDW